jgi:hypothetical protein
MAKVLQNRRWFGSGQPQTLQLAVGLLYWNALLGLIIGIVNARGFGHLALVVVIAEVAGAFGVANERRWGYWIALVASLLPLALALAGIFNSGELLTLLFQIALVALLVHPISRHYYRIYFR